MNALMSSCLVYILALWYLIAVGDAQTISTVPTEQISALEDLYLSTNGRFWLWLNESIYGKIWNFSTPNVNPCANWQGISCEQSSFNKSVGVINSIVLPSYGLNGTLPDTLNKLTNLSDLELENNYLFGSIPTTIGELSYLRYLSLASNMLSQGLPSALFNELPSLIYISVASNYLSSSLPIISPQSTSSLNLLNLSSNYITGPLPTSLSGLSKLKELYCNHNLLSSFIPDSITSLQQLKVFEVNSNALTGTIPIKLGDMKNLEHFQADENWLSNSIPPSIGNINSLMFFSVYANSLSGVIPESIGNASRLVEFIVDENRFTGTLPGTIGALRYLEQLDVYNSFISGTLPSQLSQLPALTLLLVQNCLFSGSPVQAFNMDVQTNLKIVDISSNHFTGPIPIDIFGPSLLSFAAFETCFSGSLPNEICNARSLESIVLDGLTAFPACTTRFWKGFKGSPRLTRPVPGEIPGCIWTELVNLTTLHISGNGLIGQIPTLDSYMNLTDLDLSFNRLQGTIPQNLQTWSRLRNLNLESNKFNGIITDMAGLDFSSTKKRAGLNLTLNGNRLSGVIPWAMYDAEHIVIVEGNHFTCSAVHKPPVHDPDSTSFICGSNMLDISAYLFGCCLILVVVGIALWWHGAYDIFKKRSAAAPASPGEAGGNNDNRVITSSSKDEEGKSSNDGNSRRETEVAYSGSERFTEWLSNSSPDALRATMSSAAFPFRPSSLPHQQQEQEEKKEKEKEKYSMDDVETSIARVSGSDEDKRRTIAVVVEEDVGFVQRWKNNLLIMFYWKRVADTIRLSPLAENVPEMANLRNFLNTLHVLRNVSVILLAVILIVTIPGFFLLKLYYGTVTHQYRWRISGAFFAGWQPALFIISLWWLLLNITCYYFVHNIRRTKSILSEAEDVDAMIGHENEEVFEEEDYEGEGVGSTGAGSGAKCGQGMSTMDRGSADLISVQSSGSIHQTLMTKGDDTGISSASSIAHHPHHCRDSTNSTVNSGSTSIQENAFLSAFRNTLAGSLFFQNDADFLEAANVSQSSAHQQKQSQKHTSKKVVSIVQTMGIAGAALVCNIIFVLLIKVGVIYVLISTHTEFLVKLLLEAVLSTIDLIWAISLIPIALKRLPKSGATAKMKLKLYMLYFNAIIAPIVAIGFSDISCFNGVIEEPESVSEKFVFTFCQEYNTTQGMNNVTCEELVSWTSTQLFIPPFFYNWNCYSAFISTYVPIYLISFSLMIVFIPLGVVFLLFRVKRSIFFDLCPGIFWIDSLRLLDLNTKERRLMAPPTEPFCPYLSSYGERRESSASRTNGGGGTTSSSSSSCSAVGDRKSESILNPLVKATTENITAESKSAIISTFSSSDTAGSVTDAPPPIFLPSGFTVVPRARKRAKNLIFPSFILAASTHHIIFLVSVGMFCPTLAVAVVCCVCILGAVWEIVVGRYLSMSPYCRPIVISHSVNTTNTTATAEKGTKEIIEYNNSGGIGERGSCTSTRDSLFRDRKLSSIDNRLWSTFTSAANAAAATNPVLGPKSPVPIPSCTEGSTQFKTSSERAGIGATAAAGTTGAASEHRTATKDTVIHDPSGGLDRLCHHVAYSPRKCLGILSYGSAMVIALTTYDMAGDEVGALLALFAPALTVVLATITATIISQFYSAAEDTTERSKINTRNTATSSSAISGKSSNAVGIGAGCQVAPTAFDSTNEYRGSCDSDFGYTGPSYLHQPTTTTTSTSDMINRSRVSSGSDDNNGDMYCDGEPSEYLDDDDDNADRASSRASSRAESRASTVQMMNFRSSVITTVGIGSSNKAAPSKQAKY